MGDEAPEWCGVSVSVSASRLIMEAAWDSFTAGDHHGLVVLVHIRSGISLLVSRRPLRTRQLRSFMVEKNCRPRPSGGIAGTSISSGANEGTSCRAVLMALYQ